MRRTLSFCAARVWVARTSRTWLVPMPKATAPKAPWVEVWESPQAMVIPGWVRPSWGPMTWTMPWSPLPRSKKVMPCSLVFALRASSMLWARGSWKGSVRSWVGTMWSTVAKVRWG